MGKKSICYTELRSKCSIFNHVFKTFEMQIFSFKKLKSYGYNSHNLLSRGSVQFLHTLYVLLNVSLVTCFKVLVVNCFKTGLL